MNQALQNIEQSILKAVKYLHQRQFPNGEFCCYIGHEDHMKDCRPQSHVFPTSLICYSLLKVAEIPEANYMLQLSASFLQFQSMRAGVWNEYTSWSKWHPIFPCDVDNTSCASIVLKTLNREYPDNRAILLDNRNKGGLFYTWYTFRPNKVWKKDYWLLILRAFRKPLVAYQFWTKNETTRYDIDGAVNANVLLYLGLNEDTKHIVPYLLDIISKNNEGDCDMWYRNPLVIYYFFSRNYSAGIKELEPIKIPVIERILTKVNTNGSIGDSELDTAMGLISLINLGYDAEVLDHAAQYLINTQKVYGEWPRWAIYYHGPKKLHCIGSEEITTAYCMEALALYKNHVTKRNENT